MSVSKEIAKKLNTNSSRLFFPNKEPVTIVVFYLKLKICLESNKKAQFLIIIFILLLTTLFYHKN